MRRTPLTVSTASITPVPRLTTPAGTTFLPPWSRISSSKHMFPLTLQPPRYLESLLVCLVDKGCSLYETAVRRNAYPSLRPLMPSRLCRP